MKPIGYWLNRTDRAFTTYMNAMLGEFGLTRITWQVLNVVADSDAATEAEVHTVLSANADPVTIDAAIATTRTYGWTTPTGPGHLTLTDDGRRHLARARDRVATFRTLSTYSITDDEYRTAVSVLERMTHNVETATA